MDSRKPVTAKQLGGTVSKLLENDSTSLVNSVLQRNSIGEDLSKDERTMASLIRILHGPLVKVTSGVGLTFAGILLALAPGVVLRAKTEGEVDENGDKHERLTSLKFDVRATKTPLHGRRYEIITDEGGDVEPQFVLESGPQNQLEILAAYLGAGVEEVKQLINDEILELSDEEKNDEEESESSESRKKLSAGATITGYGLITSGLGRTLSGVADPFIGGVRSLIHGGKFFVRSAHKENKKVDVALRDVLSLPQQIEFDSEEARVSLPSSSLRNS